MFHKVLPPVHKFLWTQDSKVEPKHALLKVVSDDQAIKLIEYWLGIVQFVSTYTW